MAGALAEHQARAPASLPRSRGLRDARERLAGLPAREQRAAADPARGPAARDGPRRGGPVLPLRGHRLSRGQGRRSPEPRDGRRPAASGRGAEGQQRSVPPRGRRGRLLAVRPRAPLGRPERRAVDPAAGRQPQGRPATRLQRGRPPAAGPRDRSRRCLPPPGHPRREGRRTVLRGLQPPRRHAPPEGPPRSRLPPGPQRGRGRRGREGAARPAGVRRDADRRRHGLRDVRRAGGRRGAAGPGRHLHLPGAARGPARARARVGGRRDPVGLHAARRLERPPGEVVQGPGPAAVAGGDRGRGAHPRPVAAPLPPAHLRRLAQPRRRGPLRPRGHRHLHAARLPPAGRGARGRALPRVLARAAAGLRDLRGGRGGGARRRPLLAELPLHGRAGRRPGGGPWRGRPARRAQPRQPPLLLPLARPAGRGARGPGRPGAPARAAARSDRQAARRPAQLALRARLHRGVAAHGSSGAHDDQRGRPPGLHALRQAGHGRGDLDLHGGGPPPGPPARHADRLRLRHAQPEPRRVLRRGGRDGERVPPGRAAARAGPRRTAVPGRVPGRPQRRDRAARHQARGVGEGEDPGRAPAAAAAQRAAARRELAGCCQAHPQGASRAAPGQPVVP